MIWFVLVNKMGKKKSRRKRVELYELRHRYFRMRKQTHARGFTDEVYPRGFRGKGLPREKVIGEDEQLGKEDIPRLQMAIGEEKSYLRLHEKYARFDSEMGGRERRDVRYAGGMGDHRRRLERWWEVGALHYYGIDSSKRDE